MPKDAGRWSGSEVHLSDGVIHFSQGMIMTVIRNAMNERNRITAENKSQISASEV